MVGVGVRNSRKAPYATGINTRSTIATTPSTTLKRLATRP
jgi:hypothetical protein